ncbi:MAG TPA: 16S rRNA (uracil(1498)-N(3))-methyltransferase [Polyangia bacterium]|nr:16S rRNA (uracil(1498)-N(3))-methyltransferase [Polyangia bacterium]
MAARRLFVPADRLAAPTATLTGSEHHHVSIVLRARPGDQLTLFDGAGGEVDARILRIGRDQTEVELGARRAGVTATAPITLLAAIPRGSRMDVLLQKTVEVGVARIVPLVTARSVVRPEAGRRERWTAIVREAARQCGRADVPAVDGPIGLSDALAAPDLPSRRLALFEREGEPGLATALAALEPAPTALLVGPEGGWDPAERDAARAAGFIGVGLGARILRVETAAIVAVTLAAAAYGDFS